ncbi:MAG: YhgE/Pip family protein, partial [Bacteroidota bacterium]
AYEKASLLAQGASKLTAGNRALASGSVRAVGGLQNLRQGLETLDQGGKRLASGIDQTGRGSVQLSQGLQTMSEKLHDVGKKPVVGWLMFDGLGLRRLDDGVVTAASGSSRLAEAHRALAEGASKLESGLDRASLGAGSLEGGLSKLSSGLRQTAEGNEKVQRGASLLASKLGEAAQKLRIEDPGKLAAVAAEPVRMEVRMVNPVPNYGTGFAPFFIPLVLWIGAIALFFMLDARDLALQFSPVDNGSLVLGRFLLFGLIALGQSLLLSVSLIQLLGLHPAHPVWFYATNALLSLTFVAIVGMLIGLFNLAGRFAVLIILLFQLTSSGGTFPLELNPPFYRMLSPFLPMSYGVKILRPILSGGLTDAALWNAWGTLGLFLSLALGSMILFIRRKMMIRELYEPSPVF